MRTYESDTHVEGATVHVFEAQGLGRAPFHCCGIAEQTYQACPGAPIQPGCTCDHCGTGIRYVCRISDADGRQFNVGTTCVLKTGDAGLRKIVSAWKSTHARQLKMARTAAKSKRDQQNADEMLSDNGFINWLHEQPHPKCKALGSAYDYIKWMRGHSCNWASVVHRMHKLFRA